MSGMSLCIHLASKKLIPVAFWETAKYDCKGKNRWANHIPIYENRISSISAEDGRKYIWPRRPQWSLCWPYLTIKEHLEWEKQCVIWAQAVCKHLHILTKPIAIAFLYSFHAPRLAASSSGHTSPVPPWPHDTRPLCAHLIPSLC